MAQSDTTPEKSQESVVPAKKPPPELEARQARPVRDHEDDKPTAAYGETYLIERQAIELRRARVIEAEATRQKRDKIPGAGEEFEFWDSAPSAEDDLRRYRRPEADPVQSHAAKGTLARAGAWLRRALRGE